MQNFIQELINYQKDKFLVEKAYRNIFHRRINWHQPTTFNEKINVYKISPEIEKLWLYTDKLAVRRYVTKTVGAQILNQVFGVYRNPETINFKALPDKFVLKTTHGSNWNIVCKNKTELNWHLAKQQLKVWLATNYYSLFQERQYKLIRPKIMCEKYLEDKQGNLTDYKFFCFHGRPRFIQVDIDRHTRHRRNFYTPEWKKIYFSHIYRSTTKIITPPRDLKKMLAIAKKLSAKFRHVRVDLYNFDRKIYFGELTLTHGSGLHPFQPQRYDHIIGQYL